MPLLTNWRTAMPTASMATQATIIKILRLPDHRQPFFTLCISPLLRNTTRLV
jgi:hypothetical protein